MSAVNLLLDCVCSMSFSASDLGGGETYTGPVSFKADEISVPEDVASANHATNQDTVAMHRKGQIDWTIDVKTKLYSAALLAACRGNDLGQLTITAPSGFSCSGKGLITGLKTSFGMPSEMSFTIKAHGTPITYG